MNILVTGGTGVIGAGPVERTVYSAEIVGSRYTPQELIDIVCEHAGDLMPVDFAAETGATAVGGGQQPNGESPARGPVPVRMIERDEASVTFVTTDGHPLASVLTFAAERETPGVRFVVEVVAQPANALDWIALHTLGGFLQSQNWRRVVQRVVEASGGTAPAGVQKSHEKLGGEEWRHFQQRIGELLEAHRRAEVEHAITPTP